MTDLPKVYNPMTGIEIIILSVVLAFIATVIFNILFKIIRKYVEFVIVNYRIISEFKRQVDDGEITVEEYNCKVRELEEKVKNGEIDRNG